MPRKPRRTRIKVGEASPVSPPNRQTATDFDRVRHALVDIDELACLPKNVREDLVDELVTAVAYARVGLDIRKRGVSNEAVAKSIYLADVGRALERAGLSATRWRKWYDGGDTESLFYRLAREVAEVCGINLPRELKHLSEGAAEIEYGLIA
jgi:hypothetical protein